ncbi:MAG TPA: outer membrane lipoprotein chaperone LolA [Thermodesulfobacteriota bacterium]|nr:outer membrane lipoprotein chaperone LolA [Thermodesulfobacteriota bacterium]
MKKIKPVIFILAAAFLLSAPQAAPADDGLDSVVDKVQKKYEQISDFHADFSQEAEVKALNKVQKAEGEVWFKKPGKMRWNYHTPAKDEIVSDGNTLWYYSQEEKQVIESPLSRVSDTETTSTLLSGLGKIKELFDVSFAQNGSAEAGSYLLDLKPKTEEEGYNKVTIAVDKNTMLVNTMYLYDPYGNLTTVNLTDISVDKGVPDSLFVFNVPDGVEVIKPPSMGQ